MITLGIELTEPDLDDLLPKIDNILKKSPNFTSPTYQLKSLKSINNKFILVKPKQEEFVELLQPLNLNWVEVEILHQEEILSR